MSLFCNRKGLPVKQLPRKTETVLAIMNRSIPPYVWQHSLQVQVPKADDCLNCDGREGTFLFTSKDRWRASLTVEAALAMTIFLFAVMSLLSLFFVIRTEIQVQSALEQTGNQLASLPESASLATARLLFEEKMLINKVDDAQIIGGRLGISLGLSTVMGHQPLVDLVAVYRIRLPFFPEGLGELSVIQRSRKQSFGEARYLSSEATRYVYITPEGEVYHESMYCTYIRPKTEKIQVKEIEDRRNRDGERYSACSFCDADKAGAVSVWITGWGDCYHQTEHCRGIWHNVQQVPIGDVEGRRACSKCSTDNEGAP